MSNQFFDNNGADKEFIEAIKKGFEAENLQPSSEVKANLTAAFRANNSLPIMKTLNKSIPIWQVAAGFLLLLSAVYFIKPFEQTVIASNAPIIETKEIIKENIVYKTDTIVIEKQVIQYVEVPENTKITIDKPTKISPPIAVVPATDKQLDTDNISELQLNFEVLDNFYDTALVNTIEGQNRGQSMDDMNYTNFDSLILN